MQSKFCRIDGCKKETIAFSLCWMHYARSRRNGDPMKLKIKSTVCKYCPGERYKFIGGESNLCKKHISIYRKSWYEKRKLGSEPSSIPAMAGGTGSEENSKTSADDSASSQHFAEANQKKEISK